MEPVKAVSVNRFVFKCVSATHTYSHTNFLSTFCCALNLACASKVEFLVDDKDHLIIWEHKGDECKLYKKNTYYRSTNKLRKNDAYRFVYDKLVASGGDVPVDTTRKIMEKIAKGFPNLVYLFREEGFL